MVLSVSISTIAATAVLAMSPAPAAVGTRVEGLVVGGVDGPAAPARPISRLGFGSGGGRLPCR